jgi:hypothetical protein
MKDTRRRWGKAWLVAAVLAAAAVVGGVWWWLSAAAAEGLRGQADRLVAELDALPAGEAEAFRRGQDQRDRVARALPERADALRDAERRWGERAAERAEKALARAEDWDAFRRGKPDRDFLAERFPDLGPRVRSAEGEWGRSRVEAAAAGLRSLKDGDVEGLQRARAAARPLLEEFPQHQAPFRDAENEWADRTAAAFVTRIQGVPPGEAAALQAVRRDAEAFTSLFRDREARLAEAAAGWADRTVAAAWVEAEPLVKEDPVKASAPLRQAARDLEAAGRFEAAADRLRGLRRTVVAEALDGARRRTKELVAGERYQEAADASARLADGLRAEAREAGLEADLLKFRDGCAFLADLARLAGMTDPK